MQIAKKKDYFLKENLPPYSANSEKKKTIFEMKTYHRIVQIAKKKDYLINQGLPPYSANSEKKRLFLLKNFRLKICEYAP